MLEITESKQFAGVSFYKDSNRFVPKERKYAFMYQGKGINVLAVLSQATVEKCRMKNELGVMVDDVIVDLDVKNQIYLDGRTQQVLFYIIQLYIAKLSNKPTEEEIAMNRDVEIVYSDVAKLFGVTVRSARLIVQRAVDSLYHISVKWSERVSKFENKKKKQYLRDIELRFLTKKVNETYTEIDLDAKNVPGNDLRGRTVVRLEEDFARYLPTAHTLWFPLVLYKIVPVRHTAAFAFGLKLVIHYRIINYDSSISMWTAVDSTSFFVFQFLAAII